jgi:hypothetical protein
MRRAIFGFLAWTFIVLAVLSNGIFISQWTQGTGFISGNLGWLLMVALNPWTWGAIVGAIYLVRRRRLRAKAETPPAEHSPDEYSARPSVVKRVVSAMSVPRRSWPLVLALAVGCTAAPVASETPSPTPRPTTTATPRPTARPTPTPEPIGTPYIGRGAVETRAAAEGPRLRNLVTETLSAVDVQDWAGVAEAAAKIRTWGDAELAWLGHSAGGCASEYRDAVELAISASQHLADFPGTTAEWQELILRIEPLALHSAAVSVENLGGGFVTCG